MKIRVSVVRIRLQAPPSFQSVSLWALRGSHRAPTRSLASDIRRRELDHWRSSQGSREILATCGGQERSSPRPSRPWWKPAPKGARAALDEEALATNPSIQTKDSATPHGSSGLQADGEKSLPIWISRGRSAVKIHVSPGRRGWTAGLEVRSLLRSIPGLIELGVDTRSDRACETNVL